MSVAVARIPTRPLSWLLTPPCGSCGGCESRQRLRNILDAIEEDLLQSVRDMDVGTMSLPKFYARVDAIAHRRQSMRDTFEADRRGSQCENMEIVPV